MDKSEQMPVQHSRKNKKKGGRLAPALCNVFGTGILLLVIALCLPAVLPKLIGYEVYNIVSGSMEPEIPVGSLILIKPQEASEIVESDIIAFMREESVIAHRVVENHVVEGEFVTKGDANESEDLTTTPYSALMGKVIFHVPMMGSYLSFLSTTGGKVYLLLFALCGVMFNLLAGRMREKRLGAEEEE